MTGSFKVCNLTHNCFFLTDMIEPEKKQQSEAFYRAIVYRKCIAVYICKTVKIKKLFDQIWALKINAGP